MKAKLKSERRLKYRCKVSWGHWGFIVVLLMIAQSAFAQPPQGQWTLSDTMMYKRAVSGGGFRWDSIRYNLYHPANTVVARGFILSPYTLSERLFLVSIPCRTMVDTVGIGIVYINRAPFSVFDTTKGHDTLLQKVLNRIALSSGHPEYQYAPWFTVGHSTGGILTYNIPWWKPERSIGAITYKSGKIAPPLWLPRNRWAAMADVPLMAVNGQYEEYGPGPSGVIPPGVSREIQWWSVRDSITKYRTDQVQWPFSQYVDRGGAHTNWNIRTWEVMALYISKACRYRLPDTGSIHGPLQLRPVNNALPTCYVSDTNLNYIMAGNQPTLGQRFMRPVAHWPQDSLAGTYFHFDAEMAAAWANYHFWGFGTIVSLVPKVAESGSSKIWPNPASGKYLKVAKPIPALAGPVMMMATDGRTYPVRIDDQGTSVRLDIEALPRGLYTLFGLGKPQKVVLD